MNYLLLKPRFEARTLCSVVSLSFSIYFKGRIPHRLVVFLKSFAYTAAIAALGSTHGAEGAAAAGGPAGPLLPPPRRVGWPRAPASPGALSPASSAVEEPGGARGAAVPHLQLGARSEQPPAPPAHRPGTAPRRYSRAPICSQRCWADYGPGVRQLPALPKAALPARSLSQPLPAPPGRAGGGDRPRGPSPQAAACPGPGDGRAAAGWPAGRARPLREGAAAAEPGEAEGRLPAGQRSAGGRRLPGAQRGPGPAPRPAWCCCRGTASSCPGSASAPRPPPPRRCPEPRRRAAPSRGRRRLPPRSRTRRRKRRRRRIARSTRTSPSCPTPAASPQTTPSTLLGGWTTTTRTSGPWRGTSATAPRRSASSEPAAPTTASCWRRSSAKGPRRRRCGRPTATAGWVSAAPPPPRQPGQAARGTAAWPPPRSGTAGSSRAGLGDTHPAAWDAAPQPRGGRDPRQRGAEKGVKLLGSPDFPPLAKGPVYGMRQRLRFRVFPRSVLNWVLFSLSLLGTERGIADNVCVRHQKIFLFFGLFVPAILYDVHLEISSCW